MISPTFPTLPTTSSSTPARTTKSRRDIYHTPFTHKTRPFEASPTALATATPWSRWSSGRSIWWERASCTATTTARTAPATPSHCSSTCTWESTYGRPSTSPTRRSSSGPRLSPSPRPTSCRFAWWTQGEESRSCRRWSCVRSRRLFILSLTRHDQSPFTAGAIWERTTRWGEFSTVIFTVKSLIFILFYSVLCFNFYFEFDPFSCLYIYDQNVCNTRTIYIYMLISIL